MPDNEEYFREALQSDRKYIRFGAFYHAGQSRRKGRLSMCDEFFEQEDWEIYAALLDCIPSYFPHRKQKFTGLGTYNPDAVLDMESLSACVNLYFKLAELYCKMPAKKIIYEPDDKIDFQHGVLADEILSKIFYTIKATKPIAGKKLISHFEANYLRKIGFKYRWIFRKLKRDFR